MTSGSEGPPPVPNLEGLMIWASPGMVTDVTGSGAGTIAVLTCVPSMTLHTRDQHAGADPVDVIASTLLGHGFELLVAFDRATLLDLPVLPGWSAELDAEGHRLQVSEPGGTRYDGNLGPAVPSGWNDALERRGLLVLLVASGVDLERLDRAASVDAARRAGNVVGAQIRTYRTS
ncbi:MAG TPA: hypothetical protein VH008_09510 [Pseudonocardia sp.]|nr:hypothetical protein [Pseudonocardia sp.]